MGGAAELPERSSSPLKRPASSMEPEPNQEKDVDVDVDMVSVTHTEASPSPSKLEEQGAADSQDETMAESSSVTTDDTSATWSPGQVEAHIKTIRALTEEMHTAPLEPGQEGFLVSKKWLETVLPDDSSKKTAEVDLEAIGPVDNSDIIWEVIRNPCVGDGVVDDPKKFFVRLKPQYGGEHFEILPPKAWELLRQWPGVKKGQPPIRRVANNTGDEMSSNVVFEFHPVVIPVHRVWSANSPIAIDSSLKATNPPATRLICEKTSKFQTLLAQAKRFTQIDRAQRVRVWKLPKPPAPAGPDSLTPPASPERQEGTAASDPLGQMLVEVDAFLALERDAERMIVSTDKQSPLTAVNDPTTLNALGLTQDEAIVLEEYIPENGWLTQYSPAQASAAMEITQNPARLAAIHPDGTRSGRTSPGPVTRGRARKSGRTLGCVGLHNLGNTCYMNSALQCVRSIEELTKYFLVKEWKKELNKDNVLAHNGEVASQYAHLLEEMYKDPPPGSVSPNKFKNTIGKHAPSFSGYGQQDTQEFLGFLLDGLQEDLSRVKKKPYIEKPDSTDDMVGNHEAIRKMAEQVWDITKKRDDSVIADLFTGMYKSTLVCPDCSKVSITFDPFNTLTLPLPVENKWNHTIKFFPLNDKPIDINVELDKHASIKALKEFISARVGVPADCLFGAEMWKDKFYKIYTDLAAASEEITTNDNAWFFELEAKPTNIGAGAGKQKFGVPVQSMLDTTSARAWKEELSATLLVPVFHRKPGVVRSTYHTNQRWQGCAVPHFIVVTPEEARSEDVIRRKVLEKIASLSTSPIFQDSDTAESTEPEMIGPNGSDSTSSLEGKVAAHSVQGEDDLVDVQMGVTAGENGKAADQSKPSITKHVFNHTRPEWIDPKKFLPVELQNLFEMSYFSENSARIPTGQQSIEDSREYPRLSSRVVVASPTSSEDTAGNDNSTHDAASNEDVSSDETLANTEGPATRMTEESDDDDGAVKTLPQRPKSGRQFKPVAKGPGGGRKKMKAHKTYGKGGKKKLRQQQREEEKHARAAEPEQDPYEDEPEVTESADGGPLIRLREGIVVEWTEDAFAEVFGSSDTKSTVWDSCETYIDPQLEKTQQTRAKRRKNGISIEQCLDEFERDEILSEQDMWYCPRCKEHRRASKKFDLWKTPDILVMHLKRFSSAGWRRDKLDVFVDYPVENLDITERVLQKEDGKQEVYDLIGVDCHFGGLGGGHYVAHAKSFFDNQWYHYNDSSVSKKSPESVVDTAAYLLFYRRRSDVPLGGPRFQEIFNRFAEATSGDESTEPGEARGLGEGSTLSTGSSSAIRGVGASRQLSGSLGGEQEMGFVLNRNGDDEDEGIDLNDNVLAPKSVNGISNWSFARLNEQDNGPSRTPGSPAASDVAQHDSSGDEGSTSAILQGPQIVHEFPDGPDPRAYSGMLSYQLSGDEDFASHADDSPPAYRREPSRDEDMAQIWGEKGGVLEVRPTGESERDSEDVTEIHLDNEDKL